MVDHRENVTLQGYALTGAAPLEQAIATQGYAGTVVSTEGRRVVNRTGGPSSSSLTGGRVES